MAGNGDTDVLLDLLKWPTCSPADRLALIGRWLELSGADRVTFTSTDGIAALGVADSSRFWDFVEWAGQQTSAGGRRKLVRSPENPFNSGIWGRR